MWNFLKKRRDAEQAAERKRTIDIVLAAQLEFIAMYEQSAAPASLADELASVAASFNQGRRVI